MTHVPVRCPDPKDKTPRHRLNNVVYAVQSSEDCPDLYISATKQPLHNAWPNTEGPAPQDRIQPCIFAGERHPQWVVRVTTHMSDILLAWYNTFASRRNKQPLGLLPTSSWWINTWDSPRPTSSFFKNWRSLSNGRQNVLKIANPVLLPQRNPVIS